jgi:hypothetical protein
MCEEVGFGDSSRLKETPLIFLASSSTFPDSAVMGDERI